MTSPRDSVDDLVVLARRGGLSDAERRRMREALSASRETRILHDAGSAFDLEAPVAAGDEELIERMARRVQLRLATTSNKRTLRRVAPIIAVGVVSAGLAAAAVALWAADRERAHEASPGLPASSAPSSRSSPLSSGTSSSAPNESGIKSESETPSEGASEAAPGISKAAVAGNALPHPQRELSGPEGTADLESIKAPASLPSGSGSAIAAFDDVREPSGVRAGASAQELFVAANRARVGGESATAVSLYRRLQAEFPSSNEARSAHVSLGMLYLQTQKPAAALDEFRHLRGVGGATSPAEALWGEAQALRALGRTSEEGSVLGELLERYPRSAYAIAAQRRLTELR